MLKETNAPFRVFEISWHTKILSLVALKKLYVITRVKREGSQPIIQIQPAYSNFDTLRGIQLNPLFNLVRSG